MAVQQDSKATYKMLEDELLYQVQICSQNQEYHSKNGDKNSEKMFYELYKIASDNVEKLRIAVKNGSSSLPQFHYEDKVLALLQCCKELANEDLELSFIRATNLESPDGINPDDLCTFVKYQFPYRTQKEKQKSGNTATSKSSNPEYNQSFLLKIDQKASCFKDCSKEIKCEIYCKKGMLQDDQPIAYASVTLKQLLNHCFWEQFYELTNRRKTCVGQLMVRMRVREPFVNAELKEEQLNWLVIDYVDVSHKAQKVPQTNKKASSICEIF